MIRSFEDKGTQDIYLGVKSKKALRTLPANLHIKAAFMLDLLEVAGSVEDLRLPPSNHLEKLKGDYQGYYSVRINEQWRIVFRWQDNHAENVAIVDYH